MKHQESILKKDPLYVNIVSKFEFKSIKSLLQQHKTTVPHEWSLIFFKAYFTFEKKFQTLQQIIQCIFSQ